MRFLDKVAGMLPNNSTQYTSQQVLVLKYEPSSAQCRPAEKETTPSSPSHPQPLSLSLRPLAPPPN